MLFVGFSLRVIKPSDLLELESIIHELGIPCFLNITGGYILPWYHRTVENRMKTIILGMRGLLSNVNDQFHIPAYMLHKGSTDQLYLIVTSGRLTCGVHYLPVPDRIGQLG